MGFLYLLTLTAVADSVQFEESPTGQCTQTGRPIDRTGRRYEEAPVCRGRIVPVDASATRCGLTGEATGALGGRIIRSGSRVFRIGKDAPFVSTVVWRT